MNAALDLCTRDQQYTCICSIDELVRGVVQELRCVLTRMMCNILRVLSPTPVLQEVMSGAVVHACIY